MAGECKKGWKSVVKMTERKRDRYRRGMQK